MENCREIPEGREAKEAQLEANASARVPNGKKKTASAAWHLKFPLWGKGGLISPWEAAKRAELIAGGKEEKGPEPKK